MPSTARKPTIASSWFTAISVVFVLYSRSAVRSLADCWRLPHLVCLSTRNDGGWSIRENENEHEPIRSRIGNTLRGPRAMLKRVVILKTDIDQIFPSFEPSHIRFFSTFAPLLRFHRSVLRMGYKYYNYDPNFAAAAVFVVLFGASSLFHLVQLFRKRTWYFIPFVIGGVCKESRA